jgi:hypothetical protein
MKTYVKGITITLAALVLAACGTPSSSSAPLTALTINGANDVSIEFDTSFNFFTGVTATGNDGGTYTENITLSSISTAVNTTTGVLDSTKTGVHTVQYRVTVGTLVSSKFRNVTVGQPVSTGMLINPDFSLGTAGWDDPGVVFNADGSAMVLSTEDGALKAEVTAGANAYTPRFGQMNIPFEIDTTYEVSFRAKSSVIKPINLQVGELLSGAPYFTDFKPNQPEIRTIGTEWASFSYIFTHRLDNKRGGVLFELGKVSNQQVNATMYFDDIAIEEATAGPDVTAPILNGVSPTVSILVGSTYNPLSGVTALDAVDGDLTSSIVVEILNSNSATVNDVDTTSPGVFTVNYSVEDAAGNETTGQTTVNVVSLVFRDENLLTNGSFATAIGDEWSFWSQDWGTAPVVNRSQNVAAGSYALDIINGGDASWAIQMNHVGAELVEGQTYRLSFTGSSTVERKFSAAFENSAPNNINYGRKNGMTLTTTSSTVDYIFTVTRATTVVRLTIEFGSQDGFANSVVTLTDVRLQRLNQAPLLANSKFETTGWRHFVNDWDGTTATSGIVNGEYKMTITKAVGLSVNPAENFKLQIIQDNLAFGETNENGRLGLTSGKSYTLSFDMYASKAISVTTFIGAPGVWTNYVPEANRVNAVTTSKQTITIPVSTVGATLNGFEKLSFEFGTQFTNFETGNEFLAIDNVVLKEGATVLTNVINGTMDQVLGGHQFFTENGGTMTRGANGGASIVAPELGGAAHQPHYFYIFPTLAKGNYEVKIVLTSSVTRDLRFNVILPDAGYASILPDSFVDFRVTANTPYVFTVSFEVVNPLTNVKVELDFGTLGGDKISLPGTFLLSEVLIYQNLNS